MNATYPGLLRRGTLLGAAVVLFSIYPSSSTAAAEAVSPSAPVTLFNGRDLDGWVIVGKDGDPAARSTWTVRDGVLSASGAPTGYIRTDTPYRDYTLRIEWRWVPGDAPVDANGKPRNRNSGVLIHIQGDDTVWPTCLEAQLHEDRAGDLIAMSPAVVFAELRTLRQKTADEAGADASARQRALESRRVPRAQDSSEKPLGQWNTYEIVCRGDSVTLKVNDVMQNTASGLTVRSGTIGLQSEGMPIEFRRVEVSPL